MKTAKYWLLFPIAITLILFLGAVSGAWISAAIRPGAVVLELLIGLPHSPIVAFTQATNANPASVLVLGSIIISAAIYTALAIGTMAAIKRLQSHTPDPDKGTSN